MRKQKLSGDILVCHCPDALASSGQPNSLSFNKTNTRKTNKKEIKTELRGKGNLLLKKPISTIFSFIF